MSRFLHCQCGPWLYSLQVLRLSNCSLLANVAFWPALVQPMCTKALHAEVRKTFSSAACLLLLTHAAPASSLTPFARLVFALRRALLRNLFPFLPARAFGAQLCLSGLWPGENTWAVHCAAIKVSAKVKNIKTSLSTSGPLAFKFFFVRGARPPPPILSPSLASPARNFVCSASGPGECLCGAMRPCKSLTVSHKRVCPQIPRLAAGDPGTTLGLRGWEPPPPPHL